MHVALGQLPWVMDKLLDALITMLGVWVAILCPLAVLRVLAVAAQR